jgi:hypothetical protein
MSAYSSCTLSRQLARPRRHDTRNGSRLYAHPPPMKAKLVFIMLDDAFDWDPGYDDKAPGRHHTIPAPNRRSTVLLRNRRPGRLALYDLHPFDDDNLIALACNHTNIMHKGF